MREGVPTLDGGGGNYLGWGGGGTYLGWGGGYLPFTGYAAGDMPLAFKQEDCLIKFICPERRTTKFSNTTSVRADFFLCLKKVNKFYLPFSPCVNNVLFEWPYSTFIANCGEHKIFK